MFTCSICGRLTYQGTWGLCTSHYKEFSISGTYSEVTPTGTYGMPEWIRVFSTEHHAEERRKYNTELSFSDLYDYRKEKPVSIKPTGRVRRRGG